MGMSEEERQMQLAMAASMGVEASNNNVDPVAPSENPVINSTNLQQNAEEEALARAI